MKYLVMWSGGIDSTYTLTKLLSGGHEVHAHHIEIINREGSRHLCEIQACKDLIPKLQAIKNFTFTRSIVDHTAHENYPFDMAVVCFEAGVVSRSHKFEKWTIGTHKDEGHWIERWKVIEPAARAACWPNDMPEFELLPLVSKKQEMQFLDELEILGDCWYCRSPVQGAEFVECATCKTCIEVRKELLPE